MNVLLEFDYSYHLIYIPDGYVLDIRKVQLDFFKWLYRQEKNMLASNTGQMGCAYSADDFLEYINNVVLKDTRECAYFIANKHADCRLIF